MGAEDASAEALTEQFGDSSLALLRNVLEAQLEDVLPRDGRQRAQARRQCAANVQNQQCQISRET